MTVEGEMKPVSPKNGKDFDLNELQEIVGGRIEIIYPKMMQGYILVIHEEGKLEGMAPNLIATGLFGNEDVVVGDVLFCESDLVK